MIEKNKPKSFVQLGIGLIFVGLLFAVGAVFSLVWPSRSPALPSPEVTVAVETPAPTPTVTGIQLYAFGRELDADGFTAYVGDKAFTIFAYIDSDIPATELVWRVSDDESIALTVSEDGMSCEFTALRPSGKNSLTVCSHGMEFTIPVYLWEH